MTVDELKNIVFSTGFKWGILRSQIADLGRIIDPGHWDKDIDYLVRRREAVEAKNVRAYWNNKIHRLFSSAERLLSNLDDEDCRYLGINRDDLRVILYEKKKEYGLFKSYDFKNKLK